MFMQTLVVSIVLTTFVSCWGFEDCIEFKGTLGPEGFGVRVLMV